MDFSGLIETGGDLSSIAVLGFIIRQYVDVQLLKCELRNLKEQFNTWKESHT
ncbi:MAG: hypothetical protein ACPGRX_04745 [Bdellovibrionales bacterium]